MTSQPIIKINWLSLIPWIAAIVFAFLFFRSCKHQPTVNIPNTKDTLAAIETRLRDSIAPIIRERDSLRSLAEFYDMEKDLYVADQIRLGHTIQSQAAIIRALRKDTGRTIYEQACDSLAIVAPALVAVNDSVRILIDQRERIHAAEIAGWQEQDSLTNLAYLSAVDAAVQANNAVIKLRPRASVWLGVSGSGNLDRVSAGPSLMFLPKNGRWMMGASYQIGNSKPIFGGSYHRKISFRR